MTRTARIAFALVLLAGGALGACSDGFTQTPTKKASKAEARPVLVARVVYEPVRPDRTLVATIRPRIESDLAFRVAGKVAERLVEVGQQVSAGAPIARLDTTDLGLQREQAEAELRAARGALAQVEADTTRLNTLRRKGWSTQANLDRQTALQAEAKARLDRAEKAAALAANAFSYTTLKAETAGIVTATLVEKGQVVAAGQAVVRIARPDEKEALVAVPEALVDQVRTGTATVTLWSRPDRRYRAVLREISPVADSLARTYAARFAVEDADAEMLLGMSAIVTIGDSGGERIAKLPLSSVSDTGKGPGLFVVDRAAGKIAWKPIEIARYDGGHVFVRKGVGDGEWVVALGVQKLDPDQAVRAVDTLQF